MRRAGGFAGWRSAALAIVVMLPAVAGAADDVPGADPMQRIAAALVQRGFAVRERIAGRGDAVLVFSDVHDREITGATLAVLDSLRTDFPFDVVGLENVDHDLRNLRREGAPPGPVLATLDSLLMAIDPELRDWARAIIRKRQPSQTSPLARYVDGHRGLCFGLERSDSSMLFHRVGFLHQELLLDRTEALRDSLRALDPAGAEHRWKVRGLESLGRFLGAADPACPTLPADFTWSARGRAVVERVFFAHLKWLNDYIGGERNQDFAEAVSRELARRRGHRAVVVVGYAHTARSSQWPSLQERLEQSGMSVLVADPPAVRAWLAKNLARTGRER